MGSRPIHRTRCCTPIVREVIKQADRYEIGKFKYAVIDLAQQKIVRTADIPPEDQDGNNPIRG